MKFVCRETNLQVKSRHDLVMDTERWQGPNVFGILLQKILKSESQNSMV
jgi:hypothetical protein